MAGKEIKLSLGQAINAYRNNEARLEAIQMQQNSLQRILQEMSLAMDALEGIKKIGKDNKALIPIGAGIYIDAELKDNKKVKVSLAGNVLMNKSIEKALKDLKEQRKETEENLNKLIKEQQALMQNLNSLGRAIAKMQSVQKSKASNNKVN